MFFLLPILPVLAVATVKTITIAEAISIGASVIGAGAGIKGVIDYRKANSVQKAALSRYQTIVDKVEIKIKAANNKLSDFGKFKLKTYRGIINRSVTVLSRFKNVSLSDYYDNNPLFVDFMHSEIKNIEKAGIKVSDVFSCLFTGINSAPNTAVMSAGLNWGISGSRELTNAETSASDLDKETEKIKTVLANIKNLINRLDEGEHLITVLSSKLEPLIIELEQVIVNKNGLVPLVIINKIEVAISLTRALKQIIDVDVCSENGKLTKEAGILFHTLTEEYSNDE
jgi:intracellular sulfur oxidation DsrE/DsrF family protein